jgi:photosystem II stability/assembly factor-like uncharacterized protein
MKKMILLLLIAVSAFSDWVTVETPTTKKLNSVDCIGYGYAYVVGDDRTLLRTIDFGISWDTVSTPSVSPGHDFNDVHFEDEMTGFIASDSGKIFFTSDGGATWIENTTPTSTQHFYAFDFSPTAIGLAVGTSGWIVYGPDLEWDWSDWRIPTYSGRNIYDVCYPTDSLAYILAHRDIIRITIGPDSVFYEMRIDFSTTYMNAMCTLEPGWVYIVGDSGYVVFSSDSMSTFEVLYRFFNSDLNDIAFTYSDYAVICGDGGAIFESYNYGLDWDSIPSGTTRNLNAIDFWWDDYGLIVGNSGTILRSSEPVFSPELRYSRPSDFTISAHPNPFNSAVTITAPAGAGVCDTPLRLEIFDVAGRCVRTLRPSATSLEKGGTDIAPLHKGGQGGSYIWTPDPSLGSGVYLVRARLGEESITKRVVYLK